MVKAKILRLLRQSREYISGQDICNAVGVSRTAVWKVMNQLKEDGYDIDAVQNKGYFLKFLPDLLRETEFLSVRNTRFAGCEVYYFDEVDSTNNVAKCLAEKGAPNGSIVIADLQKAGKGRRGRAWSSPSGEGIWFSLLLKPKIQIRYASMLTLVMAIAVTKGIIRSTPLRPSIKWPNDLILNGKKVCGILTEMSIQMDEMNHIVIGVGINVHNTIFNEEIQRTATSLALEMKNHALQRPIIRAELLENILEEFEQYYAVYCKTENLSAIFHEYNQYLINIGREVTIVEQENSYHAVALGINEVGELLIKKDGEIKKISSGEVSVRGIYGYI